MIESDPKVKKTIEAISAREALPVKRYVDEALTLLRSAPFPAPRSAALAKSRAVLADGRSKLVEKRILMLREMALLNRARRDLANFVNTKYANYLGSVKNRQGRDSIVDRALSPIDKRVDALKSGIEVMNEVIGDFESKAYGIRDTISAIQLGERES